MNGFPKLRLRRLRRTVQLRDLVEMEFPGPQKFMWPVFVIEGTGLKLPIEAMPGQFHYTIDQLIQALEPVLKSGVQSILLFAVLDDHNKNWDGSFAYSENGLVQRAIHELRKVFPELIIFTDVCLCAYTDHGHCGLVSSKGEVENDRTLEVLSRVAISHALAGADGVAPSAMMDGQVKAIREGLDLSGYHDTILMSYSTKFASSLYGPFREAAHSAPAEMDRKSYQASFKEPGAAMLESQCDRAEGADILMIKPILFYLDVLARIRADTNLPLAAYNVSGEYSMMLACSRAGWGKLEDMVSESIFAISRAGGDIIISYWANQYKKLFN